MPTVAYKTNNRLTAEEIEVRVWAFVIVILVSILLGAMGMFLYSVTYVHSTNVGHGSQSTRSTPSKSAPSWCSSQAFWVVWLGAQVLRLWPPPSPSQRPTTTTSHQSHEVWFTLWIDCPAAEFWWRVFLRQQNEREASTG
jgi:heme/copper-type cytochrome/quinol oxidase subunit 2